MRNKVILKLKEAGLRATPQRIATLEALWSLRNHPTADQIHKEIQRAHPEISLATVYNTLETFQQKGLVGKVKTDRDLMRYEAEAEPHHHLYCYESDRVEDYFNEELTRFLAGYFRDHRIEGFEIDDIKVQIIGKFK